MRHTYFKNFSRVILITLTISAPLFVESHLTSSQALTGFVKGEMVKRYNRPGRPSKVLIWANRDASVDLLTERMSALNFTVMALSKDIIQELDESYVALLILRSVNETTPKVLTMDETSTILDWISNGNLLIVGDYKVLNSSASLKQLFGIKSLVSVAPYQGFVRQNMFTYGIRMNELTPVSYSFYQRNLWAVKWAFGLELSTKSSSHVIAHYIQPNTTDQIPAMLQATYGKGTAICIGHDLLNTQFLHIDNMWIHVLRDTIWNYAIFGASLVLKSVPIQNPISPFVTPLNEGDELFENTRLAANYLNSLGFGVSYSNLASNINSSYYFSLVSLIGPTALFNAVFNTTIETIVHAGSIWQRNTTLTTIPETIATFAKTVSFLPRAKTYWPQEPPWDEWDPYMENVTYYHFSPNEAAITDMRANKSVELALYALQQRQKYGYNGSGVRVAIIDTGFSSGHNFFPNNGHHPFYQVYYPNLSIQFHNISVGFFEWDATDDSLDGHGTGIVSNTLAVAPGIDLHFISGGDLNEYHLVESLETAIVINASVVSCSWGFPEEVVDFGEWPFRTIENYINELVARGAIVVFAGGNAGRHAWPASMPNVVSVGGAYINGTNPINASNYASSFESSIYPGRHVPDFCGIVGQQPYGILIELPTHPGSKTDDDMFSDGYSFPDGDQTRSNEDGWIVASGTSSAAPQVAGLAAILKQIDPEMDVYEFRNYTGCTATDVIEGQSANGENAAEGYDNATGYGLINVTECVTARLVDINSDGWVDVFDKVIVGVAFGATYNATDGMYWHEPPHYPGPCSYCPHRPGADINGDGEVDTFDKVMVGYYFGQVYLLEWRMESLSLTAELSMCPDEIIVNKYGVFSVNVTVSDATDLYGWEFKLYWDNTILNCTGAQIYAPDVWGENSSEDGAGIQNDYNATHGRYWKALSGLYPATPFNGSMTVVTLTFEAKTVGTSTLDLQDTKLADVHAEAISHTASDGSVNVLSQRYMRGDQHTVNNLNAYKLTVPQSAIYKTVLDGAAGRKTIYWGIRVWKRDSAGSETEITGGTPVAQVSRSRNGEGLQSNTWSCPQTSLQSTDAIVVRVYMKFGSGEWQLCSTFITEQLQASQLDSVQWTVYYYTWRFYDRWEGITSGSFDWGTTTYNSHIQNFQYT